MDFPFYIIPKPNNRRFLMNPRIRRLADYALKEDINPAPVPVEFDPFDEKLAEPMMIAKRLTEYLLA